MQQKKKAALAATTPESKITSTVKGGIKNGQRDVPKSSRTCSTLGMHTRAMTRWQSWRFHNGIESALGATSSEEWQCNDRKKNGDASVFNTEQVRWQTSIYGHVISPEATRKRNVEARREIDR